MRRIDVLTYGLGLFVAGPVLYFLLQAVGIPALTAGIWVQTLFVIGIVAWLATYVFRVLLSKMTYNTQMQDYKEAVLAKRAEEYFQKQAEQEAQQVADQTTDQPTQNKP